MHRPYTHRHTQCNHDFTLAAISYLQALATSTPRLRSLDLSDVRLRGRSLAAAATLTTLTHLRLGTPHVSLMQDMPCLAQLTRLESLHLNLSNCYENNQVWKRVHLGVLYYGVVVQPDRM